ncbi:MAG: BamA/TamA family outer membrane protein [Myxococcales bacterium]|nr:BamA/TamA family outer membrane protein [Myxococcales bacterium]
MADSPPLATLRHLASVAILLALFSGESRGASQRSYTIESIAIRGNTRTRDKTIRERLTFHVGDPYHEKELTRSRFRLLLSGFFDDVDFRIRRGSGPHKVRVEVLVTERWTLVIDELYLGSSRRTAFWGGLAVTERNLFGRGLQLGLAAVFARHQQGYRLTFTDPFVAGKALMLRVGLLYNNAVDFLFGPNGTIVDGAESDFARIEYRRLGFTASVGFLVGTYSSITAGVRFEGIQAKVPESVQERVQLTIDGTQTSYTRRLGIDIDRGRSYLSALQLGFTYQSLNNPALPSNGARIQLLAEVGHKIFGSSYSYAKFTAQYDHYWRLPWKHTISLHAFGGYIVGATPFFNQFFIGDLSDFVPSRELELNFSDRVNPNILRSTLNLKRYEDIAGRLLVGYAIPLYTGRRFLLKADFFFHIGLIALTSSREVNIRTAADVRPFPLDLTFNLGFRFDTTIGVFGLSLSSLVSAFQF